MMSKENALKQLIAAIQLKTGLTLEEIGHRASYKGNYLSQAAGSKSPSTKIIDKLKYVFAKELATDDLLVNEAGAVYRKLNKQHSNDQDLTLQALVNMTESNKSQSEALKTVTRTAEELTQMVKKKINATGGVDQQTSVEIHAVVLAMREFLAQLAAQVNGKPVEEIDRSLDKMTMVARRTLEQMDIAAEDGKQGKD